MNLETVRRLSIQATTDGVDKATSFVVVKRTCRELALHVTSDPSATLAGDEAHGAKLESG
jgi:hypothetical protein